MCHVSRLHTTNRIIAAQSIADVEALCKDRGCVVHELRADAHRVEFGTTYACFFFRLPRERVELDYHVVRIDQIVEHREVVHHVELGHATLHRRPLNGTDCGRHSATHIMYSSSQGQRTQILPPDVGLIVADVDADQLSHTYALLVIHYHNPTNQSVIDHSGLKLYLTPPRAHVGSRLLAGSSLHGGIPPRRRLVKMFGLCRIPSRAGRLHVFSVRL
jgi:hypothetical protein